MSWFKRLCLFLFGLCGVLALAALSLTWVGPWTTQARSMLEVSWYFVALEALVCISGLGLLLCVLVSLFAPRNPRETVVAQINGSQITVTRTAISSQAKHVVEADGTCIASSIGVRVRRRGNVRVHVRVKPRRPMDVVERGERLHAELAEGLAYVCGDTVRSIDVVFTEPEQMDTPIARVETKEDAAASTSVVTQAPEKTYSSGPITVSMSPSAPERVVEEPTKESQVPEAENNREAVALPGESLADEPQPMDEADVTVPLGASDSEEE